MLLIMRNRQKKKIGQSFLEESKHPSDMFSYSPGKLFCGNDDLSLITGYMLAISLKIDSPHRCFLGV